MYQLKNTTHVTYDSNILIYYCFSTKNNKIIELTNKSKKLTEFLINQGSQIVVPKIIIDEITRKGITTIVSEYISGNNITNMPRYPTILFRCELQVKIEKNFNKLQKKEWFNVKEYEPHEKIFDSIKIFFEELINHPNLEKFLKLKKRDTSVPSKVDITLMAFSKENECPIITNDYDLTFFADELFEKGLTNRIYNFNDLDIYNN